MVPRRTVPVATLVAVTSAPAWAPATWPRRLALADCAMTFGAAASIRQLTSAVLSSRRAGVRKVVCIINSISGWR
jgi:hypothetical protein